MTTQTQKREKLFAQGDIPTTSFTFHRFSSPFRLFSFRAFFSAHFLLTRAA